MCKKCNGTGYEWLPDPDLKRYCMASVDTPEEREEAQALGWRTFMVVPEEDAKTACVGEPYDEKFWRWNDILCPATDHTKGKFCKKCQGTGQVPAHWEDRDINCSACEGHGRTPVTCAACLLCRGTSAPAPSIYEIVHGENKGNHKW